MKKHYFVILISVVTISCYAQKDTSEPPKVNVKDWGQKSFYCTDKFWEIAKDNIVNQIGETYFQKIKANSENDKANPNIPAAFASWDGNKRVPTEEWLKRMNSLRVYHVVTFDYPLNGVNVKYTVLSVPYQELYWDKTAKWDTIYFVIRSEALDGFKGYTKRFK